jgi:superoxide dismutase, Fe-Mn family
MRSCAKSDLTYFKGLPMNAITVTELSAIVKQVQLVDVRKTPAYLDSGKQIPQAQRGLPTAVAEWAASLDKTQRVVVYCVFGHEVGKNTMQALRDQGFDARYLEGGITDWIAAGGETTPIKATA